MLPICVYVMMGNKVFTYLLTYLFTSVEINLSNGAQDLVLDMIENIRFTTKGAEKLY